MKFQRDGGELFAIAWSHGESASLAGIKFDLATDSCGQQITQPEMVSGSPISLHQLKS
jgi:hypothetical protein